MFVIVECGGPNDGERIGKDGWPTFGTESPYLFNDYADAQDYIMSHDWRVNRGDFGVGASLSIDEIDGDIKYERY